MENLLGGLSEKAQAAVSFVVKAIVVVAVLFLFAKVSPAMPSVVIALVWAMLSLVMTLGFMYQRLTRKSVVHHQYEAGKQFSQLHAGRIFSFVVAFVLSAICVAGLLLESPKWSAGVWVLILVGIPAFLLVFVAVERFIGCQYAENYRKAHVVLWGSLVIGALLVVGYLIFFALQPLPDCPSLQDAFMQAGKPYEGSPSTLMSEFGKLAALADGVTAFAMAKTAEVSIGAYLIWRVVLAASSLFAVSSLLGVCVVPLGELKKVFLPLETFAGKTSSRIFWRYVALACALPVILIGAFMVADYQLAQAKQTQEYSWAESVVQDHIALAVYVVDGKYYREQDAKDAIEDAQRQYDELTTEAKENLTTLVNESFDARIENVDKYLDQYYSLPADYERLVQWATGSIEQHTKDQFEACIEEGIDDSRIDEAIDGYMADAESITAQLKEKLQGLEVSNYPDYLVKQTNFSRMQDLDVSLGVPDNLSEIKTRLGASGATGAIAGVIAKKVAEKIVGKTVFKTMVSKATTMLESEAAAIAIGSGAGSIAPVVGTAVGFVVGAVVAVGTDFVTLKIDEASNRDAYKQDIVNAINEQRDETVAAIWA